MSFLRLTSLATFVLLKRKFILASIHSLKKLFSACDVTATLRHFGKISEEKQIKVLAVMEVFSFQRLCPYRVS